MTLYEVLLQDSQRSGKTWQKGCFWKRSGKTGKVRENLKKLKSQGKVSGKKLISVLSSP